MCLYECNISHRLQTTFVNLASYNVNVFALIVALLGAGGCWGGWRQRRTSVVVQQSHDRGEDGHRKHHRGLCWGRQWQFVALVQSCVGNFWGERMVKRSDESGREDGDEVEVLHSDPAATIKIGGVRCLHSSLCKEPPAGAVFFFCIFLSLLLSHFVFSFIF